MNMSNIPTPMHSFKSSNKYENTTKNERYPAPTRELKSLPPDGEGEIKPKQKRTKNKQVDRYRYSREV